MKATFIIVDDEPGIRDGIRDSVPWDIHGLSCLGACADAEEGKELADRLRPDIVLTDIRLPGGDGLGLAEALRRERPEIRVVVMTGFDESEYARRALRIGVDDFILKPIGAEELVSTMGRIADEIEAERRAASRSAVERALIAGHFDIVVRSTVSAFCRGAIPPDQADARASAAGLPTGTRLQVLAARWQGPVAPERRMLILEAALARAGASGVAAGDGDLGDVVVLYRRDGAVGTTVVAEAVQQRAAAEGVAPPALGLGPPAEGWREAGASYGEAARLAGLALYEGPSAIIPYRPGDDPGKRGAARSADSALAAAKEALAGGRAAEADFAAVFDALSSERADAARCRAFVYRMVAAVEESVARDGIVERFREREPDDYYGEVERLASVPEWRVLAGRLLLSLAGARGAGGDDGRSRLTAAALSAIRSRYAEPLRLADVAAGLKVSANHLGSVIRTDTGMGFTEHLLAARMEAAKRLLADPASRVGEVGRAVGIPDQRYFAERFKAAVGLASRDYRRRVIG